MAASAGRMVKERDGASQARLDVLSTILQTVKLEGALFFNAEFTAPWCVLTPASRMMKPYLGAERRHVILYHYVIKGRAYANIVDGHRIWLNEGDILILPHGDAHIMGNGAETPPRDHGILIDEVLAQGLRLTQIGGGGEATRLVCGYLICDPQLSSAFLSGLPPMLKVPIGKDSAGQWLENSIRYSVGQAAQGEVGSQIVVAKLSEALFAETLRRYVDSLPPGQTGWLAGARDPDVGNALALVHRHPADPWTIARLAKRVGVSRSVLAERFRHFLGIPPMAYITRWRLQLGAQMLTTSSRSVAQIAVEVGYESEPAFNRAFKREFGEPPARFRTKSKVDKASLAKASAARR